MPARLTLAVPGLAQALAGAPSSIRDEVPCLDVLLSRADRVPVADRLIETGLPVVLDDPLAAWPAGPMRRLGENDSLPASHWCCCADPVHLVAAGDHLRMTAADTLVMDETDARDLAGALAPLLEGSPFRLETVSPHRWYLLGDESPRCSDRGPAALAGMDVFPFLPEHAGLRRMLTECQMLLHDHPVNRRREARSLAPVNSLWAWGGGSLPPAPGTPDLPSLWTDSPRLRGVWLHAGMAVKDEPGDAAALLCDESSAALVVLAAFPTSGTGAEALLAFENAWARVLVQALRKGSLRELRIAPGDGAEWVLHRHALLRFWRRRVSL